MVLGSPLSTEPSSPKPAANWAQVFRRQLSEHSLQPELLGNATALLQWLIKVVFPIECNILLERNTY